MNSFYPLTPVSHVAWMGKLMFLFLQFWFYSKEIIKIRHTSDCTEVPKIFVANWYLISQFGCPVTRFCFGEYHCFQQLEVGEGYKVLSLQPGYYSESNSDQILPHKHLLIIRQKTVRQPDLYAQRHSISCCQPLSCEKVSLEIDVTVF